jgi:CubicO group peptidase (beta-lactamase class C family)
LLAPAAAQPPATAFDELEAAAKSELRAVNAPGGAIAIVEGDRVVYQNGIGIGNVETGQPVSADMLFRVGSVTKMFTTAALVSYAEEGALKVHDARRSASVRRARESALAATVKAWGDDYFFTERDASCRTRIPA